MKNIVSLAEYLDGINGVFNPSVTYEGSFAFDSKALSSASKIKDGKNLVDEYLEKKYFSHFRSVLQKIKFIANPRLYFESDVSGSYGRDLKPLLVVFVDQFSMILTGSSIEGIEDNEQYRQSVIQHFRDVRKQLTEIQNGNITAENQDLYEHSKQDYHVNEEYRKKSMGVTYRKATFAQYLEAKKEYITNFIVGLKALFPLFDKPINLDELQECLDLDKLYLVMAKQLIDTTNLILKDGNAVHNSFVFVEKYIQAVRAVRLKGPYELTVDTVTIDGKPIKYSVDDAIREYNEIKVVHPEFEVYGKDYRDLETATDFARELMDYMDSKKLEASWRFVRKGKKEETPVEEEVIDRLHHRYASEKKLTREEKLQAIADRMSFLDHTNYVYKMTGKEQFEGYVGYIYENGIVVFEKFYKSAENHEPSISNATYIMNFNNFVQMSKLTKPEIINYIKNGGTDVRRVYHTNRWLEKMVSIITGKSYDDQAMDKIDRLINEGKITKKKK